MDKSEELAAFLRESVNAVAKTNTELAEYYADLMPKIVKKSVELEVFDIRFVYNLFELYFRALPFVQEFETETETLLEEREGKVSVLWNRTTGAFRPRRPYLKMKVKIGTQDFPETLEQFKDKLNSEWRKHMKERTEEHYKGLNKEESRGSKPGQSSGQADR